MNRTMAEHPAGFMLQVIKKIHSVQGKGARNPGGNAISAAGEYLDLLPHLVYIISGQHYPSPCSSCSIRKS